jgi:transcriptional regulator with XRE-family HTH domain
MDQKKTGNFIMELRTGKNWTQTELAKQLDLSDKTINKWESGGGYPDITIFPKLSQIFDISIEELMSGERMQKLDSKSNLEHAVLVGRSALDSLEKRGVRHTSVDEFGKDIVDYVFQHESYEGLIFCFDKQLIIKKTLKNPYSKPIHYYAKQERTNINSRVNNNHGNQIPKYTHQINRILIKGGDITRLKEIGFFLLDSILGNEIEPVFRKDYIFDEVRSALRVNPVLYKDYLKQAVLSEYKPEIINCFSYMENYKINPRNKGSLSIHDQSTMLSIIALNDKALIKRALALCSCELNTAMIDLAISNDCLWVIDDFVKKGHLAKDVPSYIQKINDDRVIEKVDFDKFNVNGFIAANNKVMISKYFNTIGKIPSRFEELTKKLVFSPLSLTEDEKEEINRIVSKYYVISEMRNELLSVHVNYNKEKGFVASYKSSRGIMMRIPSWPKSEQEQEEWVNRYRNKLDLVHRTILQTARCQISMRVDHELLMGTNNPELIKLVVHFLPDFEKDTILSQYKAGDLKIIKALLDAGACFFLESHSVSPIEYYKKHSEEAYYNNRDMTKTNLTKLNLDNAGIKIS